MSALRCAPAMAAAMCLVVAPVPAAADDAGAPLVFRIGDDRVVESSGLALSRTRPGLAYTVNDSGDDARVLVLSTRDGSVVGETMLAGAENDDFEALAPAYGGRLLVGDIGDNDAERDSVELYVIDEPTAGPHEVRPRTVELTYPDGPRDAEAVVAVGRTVYVVSKEVLAGVYAAPVLGSVRDRYTLRRVATAPSVVTDGALLPDGDVVLRGYDRGYLVRLPGWRALTSFRLPRTDQGESVAAPVDGRGVLVGSEGVDSPVYRVRVPTAAEAARSGSEGSAGAAASSGQARAQRRGDPEVSDFPRARPSGYIVAAAAAIVVGLVVRRRRRRRGHPSIRIR